MSTHLENDDRQREHCGHDEREAQAPHLALAALRFLVGRIRRAGRYARDVAGRADRRFELAGADGPERWRTCAFSVARLTEAPSTPGTRASAFSTRPTHEAQVIPSMASSVVLSRTA